MASKYAWFYTLSSNDITDAEKTTEFVDNVQCGTVNATDDVIAVYSSDERFKQDVTALTPERARELIEKLRPVMFRWNEQAKTQNPLKDDRQHYGLIAQELREVMPELVFENQKGYLAIDYVQLITVLIAALK